MKIYMALALPTFMLWFVQSYVASLNGITASIFPVMGQLLLITVSLLFPICSPFVLVCSLCLSCASSFSLFLSRRSLNDVGSRLFLLQ